MALIYLNNLEYLGTLFKKKLTNKARHYLLIVMGQFNTRNILSVLKHYVNIYLHIALRINGLFLH